MKSINNNTYKHFLSNLSNLRSAYVCTLLLTSYILFNLILIALYVGSYDFISYIRGN